MTKHYQVTVPLDAESDEAVGQILAERLGYDEEYGVGDYSFGEWDWMEVAGSGAPEGKMFPEVEARRTNPVDRERVELTHDDLHILLNGGAQVPEALAQKLSRAYDRTAPHPRQEAESG